MDKAKLLIKRGTIPVTLPSGAGTAHVKPLSRKEVDDCKVKDDDEQSEVLFLVTGLVDPQLTVEEAQAWRNDGIVGDWVAVCEAIRDASGMAEGADKSNVRGVPKRRR
jgi:hypothetical protein